MSENLGSLAKIFFENMKGCGSGIADDEIFCFENALAQFCESGQKEDAFNVYFCYCEIFKVFGEGYDNTKKLLEILSDYENNAGMLLDKHRDHYSHSAYVFALGLAIYANCLSFKRAFDSYYSKFESKERIFLSLWGACALFHDIGYPFEITHEEVKNYINGICTDIIQNHPYVSFENLEGFISFSEEESKFLNDLFNTPKLYSNMNELFSFGVNKKFSYDFDSVLKYLESQKDAKIFKDHAYFSAVLLFKQLLSTKTRQLPVEFMDVIVSILLHNSMNKFNMDKFSAPISMAKFPLAYLLILCDELQDWDRKAYGKKTKMDPLAWSVEFQLSDNAIYANYIFDSFYIRTPIKEVKPKKNERAEKLQNHKFEEDINKLLVDGITLHASCEEREKEKHTYVYASDCNFVNLCDFAKSIHANYLDKCDALNIDHVNKAFGQLSLEDKLSNIEQAKSYSKKLELVNCFFSDKELDYPVVYSFVERKDRNDELELLAREEHVRWVKDKLRHGWSYGTDYIDPITGMQDKDKRNSLKQHKDILPYDLLDEDTKEKDRMTIRGMIPLLYKHGDGIKIYRYRYGYKPTLEIAAVGHRRITSDREEIKRQVKAILEKYDRDYRVVVRSCFAPGADLLVMECANEMNLTTKASLPFLLDYDATTDLSDSETALKNAMAYINHMYEDAKSNNYTFTDDDAKHMLNLLSQAVVCHIKTSISGNFNGPMKNIINHDTWMEPARHIIKDCSKLIALWDGEPKELNDSYGDAINRGGTYHCISMARAKGMRDGTDIHIIKITR